MSEQKSARYPFSWEVPTVQEPRNPVIPGGKKFLKIVEKAAKDVEKKIKKGGMDSVMPPKHAIVISGGMLVNDGRGNLQETTEAIKGGKRRGRPKKGGNIFTDLVDGVKNVVEDVAGKKKGGNIFNDVLDDVKAVGSDIGLGKKGAGTADDVGKIADAAELVGDVIDAFGKKRRGRPRKGGFSSGSVPTNMTNALEQPLKGGKKDVDGIIEALNNVISKLRNL